MKRILKMSPKLFVDLDTGYCSPSETGFGDTYKERLSDAPLRVLNYLVNHKDVTCHTTDLAALFTGTGFTDKEPRIRGYINKIKTVFGRINPYFNSDEGRIFIQSVREKGYVFHLPKEGKLILITSPLAALKLLEPGYMAEQKKYARGKAEEVKKCFQQMESDWENTFHAVLMDLDEQRSEQRRLLKELEKYVLEADCRGGVTALTSRGADGKTVLLAQFARRCTEDHPNWNIYYLNIAQEDLTFDAAEALIKHFRQNGIGKIRKSILLIDAPDLMSDSFRNLLEMLQEEKTEWLYVLFTCRLSELVTAYQNDLYSEKYAPVRAFLVSCEKKEDRNAYSVTNISLLDDMAKQVTDYYVSEKLRKSVLKEIAVCGFQKEADWSNAKLNQLLSDLDCSKKSFVELYLELFCRAADTNEWTEKRVVAHHSCKGSMPWDDWEKTFKYSDQFCSKQKISGVLPYVFAFLKHKLPVTAVFLYYLTGYTSVPSMRELLACCDNGWFYFKDDQIKVRHESVLDAYYLLRPFNSAQISFETLLSENWMDRDTLTAFVRHFFEKIMYTAQTGSPALINLYTLVVMLMDNREYMKVLADNDMAHIPEIAFFWMEYGPEYNGTDLSGMKRAFAASFNNVLDSTDREMTRLMYWKEMLILATYYFNELPECLKKYYDTQNAERQRELMNVLQEEYTSGSRFRGREWMERMRYYMDQLPGEETDPKTKQTFLSDVILKHPELYVIMDLEAQLAVMMRSEYKDRDKVVNLFERLGEEYEKAFHVSLLNDDKEMLEIVLIKWAYLDFDYCKYHHCYELLRIALKIIPESQEGAYWIYYMGGMLRESEGFPEYGAANPFSDLDKAESNYLKALEIYMKFGDQNHTEDYLVILKALAALYYRQGEAEKEQNIYRLIEQRVPASLIRKEIHAVAESEGWTGLNDGDDDIIIPIGIGN